MRLFWRRFCRNKLALIAFWFIIAEVIVTVAAPYIAPYNPYKGDFLATWETPNRLHWLGTDDLGRDVLSRLLYGARISISVGILSQVAIAVVGVPIGALSGLKGGRLDYVIMRVIDVLSSLPAILFYILLMIALGAGFWNLILAMTLTGWIGVARLVRGQVLSLKKLISFAPPAQWRWHSIHNQKAYSKQCYDSGYRFNRDWYSGRDVCGSRTKFFRFRNSCAASLLGTNDWNLSSLYPHSLASDGFSFNRSCADDAGVVFVCRRHPRCT